MTLRDLIDKLSVHFQHNSDAQVVPYDRRGTDYGIESLTLGWLDRPDLPETHNAPPVSLRPDPSQEGRTLRKCLMVWL